MPAQSQTSVFSIQHQSSALGKTPTLQWPKQSFDPEGKHTCYKILAVGLDCRGVDVLLLGETSKWVPMSPKRVASITLTTHDIQVTLNGGAREKVTFMVLYGESVIEFYCQMSEAGTALLSVASNACNPY